MKAAGRVAVACCAVVGALAVPACSSGTDGPTVADIQALSGDQQSGVIGSALAGLLVALVTDPSGQPVPGVTVTWSVTAGSAFATPTSSMSDASGHASTSITFGNSAGPVTVQASAGGSVTVNFTATSIAACDFRIPITIGGAVTNGSLTGTDCHFFDGSYIDYYSLTVPSQQAVRVRMAAAFDAFLFLLYPDEYLVGVNDDEAPGSTNSDVLAVVAQGSYVIGANSYYPATSGDYTLTAAAVADNMTNCDLWFVTPGIILNQTLANTDCDNAGVYADGMAVGIDAGQTVTITHSSAAFDALLRLRNSAGTEVAANDNGGGGTNASITFTTTAGDFYIIEPTSVQAGATGAYTLTISGLTATGAAAPASRAVRAFVSRRDSLLKFWPQLRAGAKAGR